VAWHHIGTARKQAQPMTLEPGKMARPRSEEKKDFPPNLNRNGVGYYYYRDRSTKKCRGLGKDKEAAFRYAERMNDLLGIGKNTEIVDGFIGFGNTLTAEYVLGMAKPIKRACGIYVLIREREIVYVGKSVNCQARIGTHLNDPLKEFDSHFIIECREEHLDALEARYIVKFRPKYNIAIPKINSEIEKLFAMLDRVD
jgi:hypothetical protein